METIRLLVQNLIVIIILAVFLELLLPGGEMKRYVKFVMGLLVMVAVLGALGSLFKGDWYFTLPEQAVGRDEQASPALGEIMATAKRVGQNQQARALEEYKRALARQVSALAGMYPEVTVLAVDVDIYTDEKSTKYGQIKEIRLTVKSSRPENNSSGEIRIRVGGGGQTNPPASGGLSPEVESRLKTVIASYYNLQPDQVRIVEESQERKE